MSEAEAARGAGGNWPPAFEKAGARRREWEHLLRVAAFAGLDPGQVVIPSRGYAQVGPLSLHYVEWPAPPASEGNLLFLHGGALQARTWDAVCMILRDHYRCTALDLRGHGESNWSADGDYTLAAHAADITAFIRQRRLDHVILVGHSLGGLASILVAAAEPAVAGLVLIDIAPTTNPQATGRVREFIQSRRGFGSADELLEHVLRFAPRRRRELLTGSLVHNIQVLADGTLAWKYDPSHFDGEPVGQAELWTPLARIGCPILLVRGGRSRVVTDEAAARLVAEAPDARAVLIEQAGHTVQGDAPLELGAVIREFTRGAAPSPGPA